MLFQIKPTRCTILLSIFISTSVHVSGNYVPIIRTTYYLCDTGIFHSVWAADWSPGLQTRQTPIQSEKYRCRIDTVNSADDEHKGARNMYRS